MEHLQVTATVSLAQGRSPEHRTRRSKRIPHVQTEARAVEFADRIIRVRGIHIDRRGNRPTLPRIVNERAAEAVRGFVLIGRDADAPLQDGGLDAVKGGTHHLRRERMLQARKQPVDLDVGVDVDILNLLDRKD